MKKIFAMLMIIPSLLFADTNDPYIQIKLDMQNQNQAFNTKVHQAETQNMRAYLYLNGSAWYPTTNYGGLFGYGTNRQNSTSLVQRQGTISTNNNYIEFNLSATDLNTNGNFFCQVLISNLQGKVWVWNDGMINIQKSPITGGASAAVFYSLVDWDLLQHIHGSNSVLIAGSNTTFRAIGTKGQFAIDTSATITESDPIALPKVNVVSNKLEAVSNDVVSARTVADYESNYAVNVIMPKLDATSNSLIVARTIADSNTVNVANVSNYSYNVLSPMLLVVSQNVDTVSGRLENAFTKFNMTSQAVDIVSNYAYNVIMPKVTMNSNNINTVSGLVVAAQAKADAVSNSSVNISNFLYGFALTNNVASMTNSGAGFVGNLFYGTNINATNIVGTIALANMHGEVATNGYNFTRIITVSNNAVLTNGLVNIGTTDILTNNFTGTSVTFWATTASFTNLVASTNKVHTLIVKDGDTAGFANQKASIIFGYSGTENYANYIHTRHSATPNDNAFDFYTGDGTLAGTYPANAVHGMSINWGKVGINGKTNPVTTLDVNGTVTATNYNGSTGTLLVANIITTSITNLNCSTGTFTTITGNGSGITNISSTNIQGFASFTNTAWAVGDMARYGGSVTGWVAGAASWQRTSNLVGAVTTSIDWNTNNFAFDESTKLVDVPAFVPAGIKTLRIEATLRANTAGKYFFLSGYAANPGQLIRDVKEIPIAASVTYHVFTVDLIGTNRFFYQVSDFDSLLGNRLANLGILGGSY